MSEGDNLYTSTVIALDPQNGKLRWYYQFTPHDLHDRDATETPVLVDASFRRRQRKLMLLGTGLIAIAGGLVFYGDGSGSFVAADAETGKLLWHFNTGASWKSDPMTYRWMASSTLRLQPDRPSSRSACDQFFPSRQSIPFSKSLFCVDVLRRNFVQPPVHGESQLRENV